MISKWLKSVILFYLDERKEMLICQRLTNYPSIYIYINIYLPVVTISLRENKREQKIKDDLSIINTVSRYISNKPVPELWQGSIPPGVNVEVADHNGIEAVRVCWPLQHGLESKQNFHYLLSILIILSFYLNIIYIIKLLEA